MILSKRERYIVTAAAIVVGALVLDWYVLTPLEESWERRKTEIGALTGQMDDASLALARQKQLAPKWRDMEKGGLKSDPSEAESAVLRAVQEWSQDAGLNLVSRKPERIAGKGELRQISYQIAATGRMAAVAKFLWRADTTPLPVRVEEVQMGARREGSDDLSVQVRLSGIYIAAAEGAPSAASKTTKTASKGAGR